MIILSITKTKGVIIKSIDYKENDKLIWAYCEELGKITFIARGAKKSKSKNLALTLPLCFADYIFFKGRNLYNLQEGRIINSFQGLLDNLDKLTYSSYICELIDICVQEGEVNKNLFRDFITCIYLLNTDAMEYELLIRAFELRLLNATGYGLQFDKCSICKKAINTSDYISLSYFGGVCDTCNKEHGIYISRAGYNALRFLSNTPMDKIYRLNVTTEVKQQIEKVTTFIINSNYSRKPKSLEMLKYIKE